VNAVTVADRSGVAVLPRDNRQVQNREVGGATVEQVQQSRWQRDQSVLFHENQLVPQGKGTVPAAVPVRGREDTEHSNAHSAGHAECTASRMRAWKWKKAASATSATSLQGVENARGRQIAERPAAFRRQPVAATPRAHGKLTRAGERGGAACRQPHACACPTHACEPTPAAPRAAKYSAGRKWR